MVTRRSTNVLAIADREAADAVRFVREHACDAGLEFEDILAHLGISRATLDRWFRRWVGRSANAEINRVRLDRVQDLLATTDFAMEEIAPLLRLSAPGIDVPHGETTDGADARRMPQGRPVQMTTTVKWMQTTVIDRFSGLCDIEAWSRGSRLHVVALVRGFGFVVLGLLRGVCHEFGILASSFCALSAQSLLSGRSWRPSSRRPQRAWSSVKARPTSPWAARDISPIFRRRA